MNQKISKIGTIVKDKKLDGILLMNTSLNKLDPNITYITTTIFEYCGFLFKKNKLIIIVPRLEEGRVKEVIKELQDSRVKIHLIETRNIETLLKKLHIKKLGINHESISLSEYHAIKKVVKTTNIAKELSVARVQKTSEEITYIRTATHFADKIFLKLCFALEKKQCKTEQDIAKIIFEQTTYFGLKTSFKPIVASGKNASYPHHDPKDTLQKGFCIIDFGVKYKGYCSDMTRTIYFGEPTAQDKKLYEEVVHANEEAIKKLRVGIAAKQIDAQARKSLGKDEKYFIHGLGHGIGVEIHEAPSLNKHTTEILKEHMVFTIEPGIYIPNKTGIRIEDDIVLKKSGPEIITKTTKKLLCFKL